MAVPQLPGQRWFAWLHNLTLRVGVITGVYLSAVLVAWLLIANRVPWSANFAGIRNTAAAVLTALLMLVPIVCYLRSPARLFVAGLTAWAVFTCTYRVMGLFFERLLSRMGPFHVFMLGAVVYGCFAVVGWVVSLVWAARHHPNAPTRRRSY